MILTLTFIEFRSEHDSCTWEVVGHALSLGQILKYHRIFSIPKIGLENRMVRIFSFNGGTPWGLMCRGAPGTNPRMRQAPPLARIAFGDDFALIIDDFDHGGRPTPQK